MARYGKSSEDFNRETEALQAARRARQGVAAAEAELTGSLNRSGSALDEAASKTRLYNKAKQEQSAFEDRAARAHVEEARAIDMNTEAIARNAAAQERAVNARRNLSGAFAGARDPLFGRAAGMADPITGVSQYQLRRDLQVGQARASRLQQAVGLGISPGDAPGAPGAATRLQAAQTAVVEADVAHAQAQRAYTNALKRGDVAAAETASAAKEEAAARRQSAKAELESARNAESIAKEQAVRTRVATDPGTALIRHPELYGKQAFAPVSQPTGGRPGVREEYPAAYLGMGDAADVRTSKVNQETASVERLTVARQAQARADALVLQSHVDEIFGRQAAAAERAGRSTHYSSVELGTASQQMTRHGALTSEFITAAARGETTLREMGNQALITAGKFSAWTGAASAIYGAVAAVHELGTGAIQSSSGVNQLRRVVNDVNPDTAQKSFRDLAGQFNVPVSDASDAVYRMGQVFHNQADAVQAAKAALYSYKTGEVDVASSTQNLIAITRGFGLSSQDLLSVYDQINHAQNTFGIRIKDTEEGLAKAGGTFRNSGGDLNYLLGLFVAIQKATGRSGTEIGTGIARAANQIRKPSSQATLRALGVDVDPNNLQDTIQSALKAARKPGSDYNAIASGLFGNQYARLIAPVLRDQTTLNQALKDTSPEASKNSAQIELAKTLGQVDEQIKRIGVSLQRLGSGLAQAGAFDFIGLLLHGLNGALDVANLLVDQFDKLPEPLRTGLSLLAEMYIAMQLIRKVAPGAPIVGSPDAKTARLIQSGQSSAVQASIDDREAVARQARRQAGAAERGRIQLAGLRSDYEARDAAGTLGAADSEERVALNRKIVATEEAILRAENRALELQLEEDAARQQVVVAEQEQARYKKLQAEQGAKAVVAEASRQGLYMPGQFGLTSKGAQPVEHEAIGAASGLPMIVPTGMSPEEAGAAPPRDLNRLERAGKQASDRLRSLAETGIVAGRAAGPVRTGVGKAADGLDKAATSLSKLPASLGGLKAGFGALLESLGPLDYILVGLLVFSELKSKSDQVQAALDKTTTTLESQPTSQAAYDARNKAKPADPGSFGVHAATWVSNFGGIQTLQGKDTPLEDAQYQQQLKRLNDAEMATRARLQAQARARGGHHPIPLQFLGEITKQIDQDSKDRNAGLISMAEFDKRMHQHSIEIQTAYNADPAGLARAKAALEAAKRQQAAAGTNYKAMFQGASTTELVNDLAANAAVASTFTGSTHPRNLEKLRQNYYYLRQQIGSSNDPKEIQQLLQARDQMYQALEGGPNSILQFRLSEAHTPGARQAAYTAAYRQIGQNFDKLERDQLKKDLADRDKARETVLADKGMVANYGNMPIIGGRLKQKLARDTAALRRLEHAVSQEGNDIADALREKRVALDKIKDDAYQGREQGRQTQLAYQQSTTTDTARQNAMAIQSAEAQVRDARRTYGQGSDEWMQAMTTLNQARQQTSQTILQHVQAENALITARASGDPASAARAAVTVAQNTLEATRRATPNDRDAITQAQASLISARIAYANFLKDQAAQIHQARFALRESRTADPVTQARLEMEAARQSIRDARTEQDRINARADYNNKRRAYQSAQVQASEDDVQFELDMDRITRAQAIDRYQQILRGHHLTQQMRRDLQLRIHQLQQASNSDAQQFDLAVGAGIKLPTIYDVRRSIKTARMAGDQGSQVTANNKIDVNVTVNDPNAAGAVFDAIDQAMGTSVNTTMRQAGVI